MRGEEEREKVRWEKKKREGGGEEERSIYTPARSRRGKRPYPRGLVRSRFDDFSFSSFSLSFFFCSLRVPARGSSRGRDEINHARESEFLFLRSQEVGVYFGAR